MTDREFVESKWERAHECDGSYRAHPRGMVLLFTGNHLAFDFPDWALAAEFTRNRMEEIRQLEREIEWCGMFGEQYTREDLDRFGDPASCADDDGFLDRLPDYARDFCTRERILARLQRELAELKRGMKA